MQERIETALKRAAEVANLEMQRESVELSLDRLQEIHDHTALLEDELEFLDLEIAGVVDVPRKLNDLIAVRGKITAQMDIHRSLCAPVHRLFPELLSEIFVYATKSASKTWASKTSQLAVACKLASIIAVWRRVAHGTPLLWPCLLADDEHQWNTYLERIITLTGSLPLVAHCLSTRTTELFVTQPAMHARRWRVATLCSPICAIVPAAARVEAPTLEDLTVHGMICDDPEAREVTDYLVLPRLRCLRVFLTNRLGVGQALIFRMPPTLTSFTLTFRATEAVLLHVVNLLHQCASTLENLFVNFGTRIDERGWSIPVFMPALKTLTLYQDGCLLLECINAPAIEQLTIEIAPMFFVESLTIFLERNDSSVSHLIYVCIAIVPELDEDDTEMLVRCLGRLERLEELHFTDTTIPLDLVRSLICYESVQPALPKLRVLSLDSLPTPEHEAALRDVYASRRWNRCICGMDIAILEDPDEVIAANA
ncbi:uncharacterized protein SCHCODRAFT_02639790 [Schizophyllum commune H4-8]|nr:uncharacterized protein SCHCODRAFT_02639790 [Schizophyllum commune H4-8]KAI5886774.1 hypothetical protein SCHCODRAFT_02639790 [Schizophyllum commune H4-8]